MTLIAPNVLWINDAEPGPAEAIGQLRNGSYDVAVIEAPVSAYATADVLEEALKAQPGIPVLVHDVNAEIADAVRYVRMGAYDVAGAEADLPAMIDAAIEFRRGQRAAAESEEPWRKFLVGASRAMQRTGDIIRLVGSRRSTVLITGE